MQLKPVTRIILLWVGIYLYNCICPLTSTGGYQHKYFCCAACLFHAWLPPPVQALLTCASIRRFKWCPTLSNFYFLLPRVVLVCANFVILNNFFLGLLLDVTLLCDWKTKKISSIQNRWLVCWWVHSWHCSFHSKFCIKVGIYHATVYFLLLSVSESSQLCWDSGIRLCSSYRYIVCNHKRASSQ